MNKRICAMYNLRLIITCIIYLLISNNVFSQQRQQTYADVVFNRLVKTINQSTPAKPQLIIVPSTSIIATTNNNGEIVVGSGLLQHCRSFGKDSSNAIAHILAHELTHYYSNHFWTENFGSAYADHNWGKLIESSGKTLSSMKLFETQADEYGMYYAFAAGYKTLQIGDQVLDSVYKWYGLDEQIPGYPSLHQRKLIARDAKKNITRLIPAFETGNLLLTLAQIHSGEQQAMLAQLGGYYFEDILANKIQTKEIYNNTGLTKVLQVLQYFNDSIQQIRFPFMLESKSMLYTYENNRGNATDVDSAALALIAINLEEAEQMFSNAIKTDKNFYPSYINLSIVAFLNGKYGTASDHLSAASKIMGADHSLIWAVFEMEAIVEQTKNLSKMQELFAEAINKGSATALYNLQYFSKKINPLELAEYNVKPVYFSTDTSEQFENISIFHYLDNMSVNRLGRIDIISEKAVLYTDTLSEYVTYYIRPSIKPSLSKLRCMVLKDNVNASTSKGLQRGNSVAVLEKFYGEPTSVVLESKASIWSYPAQNLIVWVEDGVVKKWGYWWII